MVDDPKRILVAEDNLVLLDVLRFNLEHAGFNVTSATNGSEAIIELTKNSFDLLITDYQMPLVGGEELCRYVRETLHLTDLRIIVCSAKGLELDTESLRARWNVCKVIFKPFSLREIVSLTQSLTSSPVTAST